MYQYQQSQRYFAQIAHGTEALGAAELAALGATEVTPAYRGLYFTADAATLYRINYQSRLLTRVLAPLLTFECHSDRYLYKTARTIPWGDLLSVDETFAVFANVSHSKIRHSKYAALRLKDAIVDQFRDACGVRPSIDTRQPDLWINLHIERDRAVISIDTSGGSLHRRGYRQASVEAPMQETVAAAVIALSGWTGATPLYDPMCGAGTLLCEALMVCGRTPAGILRTGFGFERLPDFDAGVWQAVRAAADAAQQPVPAGWIGGSDVSGEAVAAAQQNLLALPEGQQVAVRKADYRTLPALENTTIVCNPPYGLRLRRGEDLRDFYQALGDFLKQRCTGSTAFIYFGDRAYIKSIGLRAAWKKPLVSGALDGRLARYDLY